MSSPRRGSMGFYPRVRARSIRVRVKSWPSIKEAVLLGFPAYKVGMLSSILLDAYEKSHLFGKEVIKACTVLEAPPVYVLGLKLYKKEMGALKSLTTIFSKDIPKKIKDHLDITTKSNKDLSFIDEVKDHIAEIRTIVATQPFLTGIGKKKPEIFEIKIGGELNSAIEYAKRIFGKEVSVKEVFKELSLVDVIGVTKGKGFQGVVKRFHVKVLPKWHKHRKGSRKVGSIGPIEPSLMRFVPRPGQMGFHRRTEYNKLILQIGEDPNSINPKGGFKHYGLVKNNYILLLSSIIGPPKRVVFLRYPIRPQKRIWKYQLVKIVT